MSKIFKASFLLTFFFGLNKLVALLRQYLTAQQFGLNKEMDAFNIANNIPDLLFSVISGSALALAFIPALTEYLEKKGEVKTWQLFSQVANIVFIATACLATIAAVFAPFLVRHFIAPGFSTDQQELTTSLMRLNLLATLIFSVSGLLTAALQAHKHFLFPALAPIFHNLGLLIGLFFFVKPVVTLGLVNFPGLGAGIFGLEFGVILGAVLHLGIQIPAALRYKFRWLPLISLSDSAVQRVFKLMGPRILTVLLIQAIFLTRDNLASGMESGAISALTYGFFLLQVPETLIGTAIGTALLPTLSDYAAGKRSAEFIGALQATIKVILASCLVITTVVFLGLDSVLSLIFHLTPEKFAVLSLTTKMFFLGLTAHSLLEVTSRAFYALQDTRTPFYLTIGRVVLFVVLGFGVHKNFGAPGLAMADALSVTTLVGVMLWMLNRSLPGLLKISATLWRTGGACLLTVCLFGGISQVPFFSDFIATSIAGLLSVGAAAFILKPEIQLLRRA